MNRGDEPKHNQACQCIAVVIRKMFDVVVITIRFVQLTRSFNQRQPAYLRVCPLLNLRCAQLSILTQSLFVFCCCFFSILAPIISGLC